MMLTLKRRRLRIAHDPSHLAIVRSLAEPHPRRPGRDDARLSLLLPLLAHAAAFHLYPPVQARVALQRQGSVGAYRVHRDIDLGTPSPYSPYWAGWHRPPNL